MANDLTRIPIITTVVCHSDTPPYTCSGPMSGNLQRTSADRTIRTPARKSEPSRRKSRQQSKFDTRNPEPSCTGNRSLPVPLTDIDTEVGQCVAVFGRFVFGEHGHRPREVFLHDAGRLFHTALVLDDVLQIFDRLILLVATGQPCCNSLRRSSPTDSSTVSSGRVTLCSRKSLLEGLPVRAVRV